MGTLTKERAPRLLLNSSSRRTWINIQRIISSQTLELTKTSLLLIAIIRKLEESLLNRNQSQPSTLTKERAPRLLLISSSRRTWTSIQRIISSQTSELTKTSLLLIATTRKLVVNSPKSFQFQPSTLLMEN